MVPHPVKSAASPHERFHPGPADRRRRHQRRRHRARCRRPRARRCSLVEQDDLASHTSSASTKLIHGGLRYLEYYEFRLVAEALAEREVLLKLAPHLIEPLSFVLPHEPHLRPAWMIRAGLFMYDHLGGRMTLPKSFGGQALRQPLGRRACSRALQQAASSTPMRASTMRGWSSSTRCRRASWARTIRTHTTLVGARRDGPVWRAQLDHGGAAHRTARARDRQCRRPVGEGRARSHRGVAGRRRRAPRQGQPHRGAARAPRGARVHPAERRQPHRVRDSVPGALLADRHHRHHRQDYAAPHIADDEIDYLLELVNSYLATPLSRSRHRVDLQRRAPALRRRRDATRRRSRATTC